MRCSHLNRALCFYGENMGIQSCFAKYGAKLKNVNWSVSALNEKGELVCSLWNQFFQKGTEPKTIVYADRVSRWSGHGNNEFRANIEDAFKNKRIIRAVIARTNDEKAVSDGKDASKLKNKFHTREDWIGVVSLWDGDNFEITFKSET